MIKSIKKMLGLKPKNRGYDNIVTGSISLKGLVENATVETKGEAEERKRQTTEARKHYKVFNVQANGNYHDYLMDLGGEDRVREFCQKEHIYFIVGCKDEKAAIEMIQGYGYVGHAWWLINEYCDIIEVPYDMPHLINGIMCDSITHQRC